jgi:hypothetical protein
LIIWIFLILPWPCGLIFQGFLHGCSGSFNAVWAADACSPSAFCFQHCTILLKLLMKFVNSFWLRGPLYYKMGMKPLLSTTLCFHKSQISLSSLLNCKSSPVLLYTNRKPQANHLVLATCAAYATQWYPHELLHLPTWQNLSIMPLVFYDWNKYGIILCAVLLFCRLPVPYSANTECKCSIIA